MTDINQEDIVCCICGCTETSKWLRYKDKKGIWDEKSYICKSCYGYLKRYGTVDKGKIEKNKRQYIKDKRNKVYCCICEGIEMEKISMEILIGIDTEEMMEKVYGIERLVYVMDVI